MGALGAVLAGGLLAVGSAGAQSPATSFSGPTNFLTGPVPWLVAAGDLNRDGRPDLVTANAGSLGPGGVSVSMNTTPPGAATPSLASPSTHGAGVLPLGVALGDLDGDGLLDLAVANALGGAAGTGSVSVLLNRTPTGATEGSYDGPFNLATGPNPSQIAAGDLNGDGRVDLVTGNGLLPSGPSDTTVSVLLNVTAPGATQPSFTHTDYPGGGVAEGLGLGDLDSDGSLDIVTGNTATSDLTIYLNRTPPGATTPVLEGPTSPAVPQATGLDLGDLNGDGRLDLAVASTGGGVYVLLNTTEPASPESFAAPVHFDSGSAVTEGVAIADYNLDGQLDVAVVNDFAAGTGNVSVFVNQTPARAPAPVFAGPDQYTAGNGFNGANSVVDADINSDTQPDIVTAQAASGQLPVLADLVPAIDDLISGLPIPETLAALPIIGDAVSILLNTGQRPAIPALVDEAPAGTSAATTPPQRDQRTGLPATGGSAPGPAVVAALGLALLARRVQAYTCAEGGDPQGLT